jgi:O-antigen/teichoic acid export membrane protein
VAEYHKQFVQGSTITFIGLVLAAGLSYLLRIILARVLPVEEVGLFFSILNFIVFVSLFQRLGVEVSLVRFINIWKVKGDQEKINLGTTYTLLYQLVMAIIFMGGVFIFSDYLAESYFNHPAAKLILLSLSSLLILLIFEDIPRRIFQSFNKMFWFSFIEAFKVLFFLVLVIVGFIFNKNIIVPTIAFLIATVSVGIIGLFVSLKVHKLISFKLKGGVKIFKQLFIFGLPLIFLVIGNKVIESLDVLILTYFRDLSEVGVYSMVLPTAALGLFFFRPLAVMILPLGTELWQRGLFEELTSMLKSLYYYLFLLILPVIVLFVIFAKELLILFFGTSYSTGALPLQIILLGVFFFGLATINIGIITGTGNSKNSGKVMLYGALSNLILNLILIPFFGMVGAAIATTFCYFFTYYLSLKYLKTEIKEFRGFFKLKKMVGVLVVFTLFTLITKSLLNLGNILNIVLTTLISVLFYIILISSSNLFSLKDFKNLIQGILKK